MTNRRVKFTQNVTKLFAAIDSREVEVIKALLEEDIKQPLLLQRGPDTAGKSGPLVNRLNQPLKATAIQYAIRENNLNLEVIRCLLEAGADIYWASAQRKSALLSVIMGNKLDILELFIQQCPGLINESIKLSRLSDIKTPVLSYVINNKPEILKLFIQKYPDLQNHDLLKDNKSLMQKFQKALEDFSGRDLPLGDEVSDEAEIDAIADGSNDVSGQNLPLGDEVSDEAEIDAIADGSNDVSGRDLQLGDEVSDEAEIDAIADDSNDVSQLESIDSNPISHNPGSLVRTESVNAAASILMNFCGWDLNRKRKATDDGNQVKKLPKPASYDYIDASPYTPDDMSTLLKHYVPNASIIDGSDVNNMAAGIDKLRNTEALDYIVVPINLTDHWVGMVIKKTENAKLVAFYSNPRGARISKTLKNLLEEKGVGIVNSSDLQDHCPDKHESGPLTVINLVGLALEGILQNIKPDDIFLQRQLLEKIKNTSTELEAFVYAPSTMLDNESVSTSSMGVNTDETFDSEF